MSNYCINKLLVNTFPILFIMNKATSSLLALSIIANNQAIAAEVSNTSPDNYIGVSSTVVINSKPLNSVTGRVKLPIRSINLSVRPELTINNSSLIGGGAALTVDTKLPIGTLYSGFGAGVEQLFPSTRLKTYGVVGLESKVADAYTVYGNIKLPFSTEQNKYNPALTVGVGYNF